MYETSFYLVLQFCEHDLAGLSSNGNVTITVGEIKNMMLQLLYGLCYIHNNKVCIDSKVLPLALYM
jgi:serine/threonine protein kinase